MSIGFSFEVGAASSLGFPHDEVNCFVYSMWGLFRIGLQPGVRVLLATSLTWPS